MVDNLTVGSQEPQPTSNVRSKTDLAWKYAYESSDEMGKKSVICMFCQKGFKGGGINRMKQHLGHITGQVVSCKKVDAEVKFLMNKAWHESKAKGKSVIEDDLDLEEDPPQTQQTTTTKRKASSQPDNLQAYFKLGTNDLTQRSIKSALHTKERLHDTDLAFAMWLYDACIPMNAVNSPLFPIAMSKIASMGHGYLGPTYHAVRVNLLQDAKTSVKLVVDSYRTTWAETGCTIMSDGWRDARLRPLINFLVYSPKGIVFLKSVDASDIESNAESLCNLFGENVEIVGVKNVVQLVTDNAANYKAAGKLLSERYPPICWSPCAHCINLIMKDISEMPSVADLITLASLVTVFIYNHKWPLNWLRKREGWTEIIRPGATRFGTSFIALKSLYDHKSDLQAMVTSNDFKKMLKTPKARDVRSTILEDKFWQGCLIAVKVMGPVLRLLRICDSDEKPALGYVYEGMSRARKGIIELFKNKANLYKPYTDIIDARWDKMLKKSLHATAYWLNPAFQYDEDNADEKRETWSGVLDMLEKMGPEASYEITPQLMNFRKREGGFGRALAVASCKRARPDEWWQMFGGDYPELQSFAIRILSQTASSSGCERNWSVFERIHTKRRNRLEHQRLSDLVCVHYNLRLQNRLKDNKRTYDPVDYESIDKTEFWVIDEEAEGELDYDELENMLNEEPPNNIGRLVDEEDDEVVILPDDPLEATEDLG